MGAILYAIEVPPYGGDTLFANQYQAYETLSDGMKKMLSGLRALHSDRKVAGPQANKNALPRHQGARGRRLARDRERAPRGGDASRDRPQAALRQPLLHRSASRA